MGLRSRKPKGPRLVPPIIGCGTRHGHHQSTDSACSPTSPSDHWTPLDSGSDACHRPALIDVQSLAPTGHIAAPELGELYEQKHTSYRSFVGQLYWNDRQKGVISEEACAFSETVRQAAMALPGGVATLGPTASLGTIMGMAAMLPSEASDRSTRPLSRDTAATCSTMHPSTDAQEKAMALPSTHSSTPDDNIESANTEAASTAYSIGSLVTTNSAHSRTAAVASRRRRWSFQPNNGSSV